MPLPELPQEIYGHVGRYLRSRDRAVFARTAKAYYQHRPKNIRLSRADVGVLPSAEQASTIISIDCTDITSVPHGRNDALYEHISQLLACCQEYNVLETLVMPGIQRGGNWLRDLNLPAHRNLKTLIMPGASVLSDLAGIAATRLHTLVVRDSHYLSASLSVNIPATLKRLDCRSCESMFLSPLITRVSERRDVSLEYLAVSLPEPHLLQGRVLNEIERSLRSMENLQHLELRGSLAPAVKDRLTNALPEHCLLTWQVYEASLLR